VLPNNSRPKAATMTACGVMCALANSRAPWELRVYADGILIISEGKLIGDHLRYFGRGKKRIFNLELPA
jgi:hypothetical protein